MTRSLRIALLALLAGASAPAAEPLAPDAVKLHIIDAGSPQGLIDLFKPTADRLPIISAHRGGAAKDYPENCIATFEYTLRHTFAIMEVDPRYTKDGKIVLHHDATLDRTTTGKGKVADHTLAELKQLRLKDAHGNVTEHTIPTLDEAIAWARGKTVLVLDQKDVPAKDRLKVVMEHKAQAWVMLIVYSFNDAKACYETDNNIMMEVMIPSREKAEQFEKLGVPWKNVIAFVGHTPPAEKDLCKWLRAKGASTMTGTSRNLDKPILEGKVKDIDALTTKYQALLDMGVDVIEADAAREVSVMLYGGLKVPESKAKYLRVTAIEP